MTPLLEWLWQYYDYAVLLHEAEVLGILALLWRIGTNQRSTRK